MKTILFLQCRFCKKLIFITFAVGSWFVSPLLSGIMSVTILFLIKHCILLKKDPLEAGLTALPIFYSFTILVNVFSIVHDGPKLLYMDNIPLWMAITISVVIAFLFLLVIKFIFVPWQRKKILSEIKSETASVNFNIGESSGKSKIFLITSVVEKNV